MTSSLGFSGSVGSLDSGMSVSLSAHSNLNSCGGASNQSSSLETADQHMNCAGVGTITSSNSLGDIRKSARRSSPIVPSFSGYSVTASVMQMFRRPHKNSSSLEGVDV